MIRLNNICKQDASNPQFIQLIKVMHSKEVVDETMKLFPGGAAIPAWQGK